MATTNLSQKSFQTSSVQSKKCECCKTSYAEFKATIPGGEQYNFCWRCSQSHRYAPDRPGFELKHKSIVPDPPADEPLQKKKLHPSQYETCYCCQKTYYKQSCTRLNYECGKHTYVFCMYCCGQHEYCLEDTSKVTNTTYKRFSDLEQQINEQKKQPFELA